MKDSFSLLLTENLKWCDTSYQPLFFNLSIEKDRHSLENLLSTNPHILIHDQIHSQLGELLKSRHPRQKLTSGELDELIVTFLGGKDVKEYGLWVYYPWSFRLTHILNKPEFIEVRTNRNQYKITQKERDILASKCIGIVGLSVGKTIAMAMAMERSFGEIRLADYDVLELTNLNRIQTGLHNLGVSKAVATAREIAELDPFLKTVCFTEGLTENNLDDFFTGGGKLDILIEECDGLDIKILCRQKAKALKIPVVMDMNDRGTLDVERFDLEPERPLLHGFIDHLDISQIKNLSNEEKVPYILPMLGSETISSKLKASMIEIGQTITTWPQLASSVTLGGALASDVCRRIALDQFHESGRYFVDLEELICDSKPPCPSPLPDYKEKELTEVEMMEAIRLLPPYEGEALMALTQEQLLEIVRAGVSAPTAGNNQPWKWLYHAKQLFLFHDTARSSSDFNNIFSNIGLGAASENVILKAHQLNLEVSLDCMLPNSGKLVSVFRFFSKNGVPADVKIEKHSCDKLAEIIFKRSTNRKISFRQEISNTILDELREAALSIPGAGLLLTGIDEPSLMAVSDIVSRVDRLRMMNAEDHRNFVNEIRWTREEAEQTRDGVDIATVDLSPSELAGFRMARSPEVIKHLNTWNGGRAFEKLGRKTISTASAIALITMPGNNPGYFYSGGRALERVWLCANSNGISVHPVSACTYFFHKLIQGKGMNAEMIEELTTLRADFRRAFNLQTGASEIFLIKLHCSEQISIKALRRNLDNVLNIV